MNVSSYFQYCLSDLGEIPSNMSIYNGVEHLKITF